MITVYGYSDDLIEVEGDIREEFGAGIDDDGELLAFSTGVLLRITYTKDGVWRINALSGVDKVKIVQAPAGDEKNYSDRATIEGPVKWILQGENYHMVAKS